MDEKPWWHAGLRFECSQCGDCCTGAPGFVWVNREEIVALAAEVGLEVDEFERKDVKTVGVRKSLDERANGDCRCSIPRRANAPSTTPGPGSAAVGRSGSPICAPPQTWQQTCQVCPGSGKGPVVPAEKILHQVGLIRI